MPVPAWLRFLLAVPAGTLFFWAMLALWVTIAPLSILNTGQTSLLAKDDLLKQCPAADIVVFGDSRAEAGIDPGMINRPTVNFARGGGSLMEDYYRLRRYLDCGARPRLVILSYTLPEFVRLNPQGFWKGTVIAHLLPFAERDAILAKLAATGRNDAFRMFPDEGVLDYSYLPTKLKNLLYQIYFPPLYAPSMVNSLENGILFRYIDNIRVYYSTLHKQGRSEYHPLPHDSGPGREAALWTGEPNPAIDFYLHQVLALLQEKDIPVMLVLTPVNDATYQKMSPKVREHLMSDLGNLPAQFKHLIITDSDLPHWPPDYFGDPAMHLNARGAAAVAEVFNRCLGDLKSTENLASCHLGDPPPLR